MKKVCPKCNCVNDAHAFYCKSCQETIREVKIKKEDENVRVYIQESILKKCALNVVT